MMAIVSVIRREVFMPARAPTIEEVVAQQTTFVRSHRGAREHGTE